METTRSKLTTAIIKILAAQSRALRALSTLEKLQ